MRPVFPDYLSVSYDCGYLNVFTVKFNFIYIRWTEIKGLLQSLPVTRQIFHRRINFGKAKKTSLSALAGEEKYLTQAAGKGPS